MIDPVRIGDATLYLGDVLSVLAGMADESVHCVVTSPPYWGLRDYGTGTWEGGEQGCSHEPPQEWIDHNFNAKSAFGEGAKTQSAAAKGRWYRPDGSCRCGARRIDQQIGLEETPEQYVAKMVAVFREVRRVLRADGTAWVNLGDSYVGGGRGFGGEGTRESARSEQGRIVGPPTGAIAGLKPKDLVGIPWRVAFALQADGWYLRSDIIWAKPNPMPESVTDRPTKAHEYLFLLSKSARYFYDADAVREPHVEPERGKGEPEKIGKVKGGTSLDAGYSQKDGGWADSWTGVRQYNPAGRNRRTVWTIATEPYPEAHFATFPRKLVSPCILAGCPEHACPKCGAPWVRQYSRELVETRGKVGEHNGQGERVDKDDAGSMWNHSGGVYGRYATTPGSEHPTCACGLAPIGGVVMDPFGGSGTTAEVALEYGRRAILIELKPEYVELAKRRLRPVAGRPLLPFAAVIL